LYNCGYNVYGQLGRSQEPYPGGGTNFGLAFETVEFVRAAGGVTAFKIDGGIYTGGHEIAAKSCRTDNAKLVYGTNLAEITSLAA
jgi:hypothetical protein